MIGSRQLIGSASASFDQQGLYSNSGGRLSHSFPARWVILPQEGLDGPYRGEGSKRYEMELQGGAS